MTGEIIVLQEEFEFRGVKYLPGYRFRIIGDDSIRGWDIEDEFGNKIYECRFIQSKFKRLQDIRNEKIDKIL